MHAIHGATHLLSTSSLTDHAPQQSGLEIYNEALYDLLTKTPQTSTTGGAAPTTPLSARVAGQWGLASSKGTPRGDSPHAHGVGALSSSTSRGGLEIMEDPEKGVVVPGLIEVRHGSEPQPLQLAERVQILRVSCIFSSSFRAVGPVLPLGVPAA